MRIIIAIIFLLQCSCMYAPSQHEIIVRNLAGVTFDSIRVHTYDRDEMKYLIKNKEEVIVPFKVDQISGLESAFGITVYIKDSVVLSQTFGYYSGPSDIRPKYWVEIRQGFKLYEIQK